MFLLVFAVAGMAFFSFASPDLAMAQNPDTPTEDQDKDDGGGMDIQNKMIILFGWLIYFIVWVLGKILLFVIGWLTQVASWDQFIGVPAVIEGWTIIRDLCNMFFILLLLAIAFATILRVESYNIKRLLPKVIIAAILINFSRTICGLVVDFSQIVMLTFVNAFAGAGVSNNGANNLVNMLGMDHMMDFIDKKDDLGGDLGMKTVGGIVVALIASLIAFVVICAMLAVLLFRIIMIWVYIVLSPLAFLLFAFPHGKGYASRWLSSFSKQVIVGPVLAFFLWLALYTANESSARMSKEVVTSQGMEGGIMSSFLEATTFQTYIITIAFLLGGLIISQEIGEVSGKAAGKGLAAINKGKAWTGKQARRPVDWGAEKGKQAAKGTAKGAGRIGLATAGGVDRIAGRMGGSLFGKGEEMSKQGLVRTAVGGGMRLPSNVVGNIQSKFRSQEAYRRTQRNVLANEDKNGFYADDQGNRYKSHNGYYKQVDEHGNLKKDEQGNAQYLKDDEGNSVKRMNKALAAFYDSWTDVQSGSRAASNKAQDERVETERKKLEDANTSEDELINTMNDVSASRDKRMAAAIQTAIKKGFKDKNQIDQAKKLVGSNDMVSDKLEKEVDKNQAHLAYDFSDKGDRDKFKKKLEDGDIDSTKLKGEAYGNKDLVSTLKDYHGDEWGRVAESIYKRGDKKTQDNFAEGIKESREDHYDKETGEKTEDWSKMAKLHAKLTGKVDESFTDKKGDFHTQSFQDYVQTNKAANLNKIKSDNLQNLIKKTAETKGESDAEELEKTITQSFGYGKVKSMHKQGDNPELVRTLRDMTMKLGKKQDQKYIVSDHELNSA